MLDELLLLSGNDIPFPIARLTIHQPRLKEIAYITEERFWPGCEYLKFDKDFLEDQDKIGLSNRSNFNIIMSIIQDKSLDAQKARIDLMSVLALLFPTKEIKLSKQAIILIDHQTNEVSQIDETNFQPFKQIFISMFCLSTQEKQYNPSGELAKKIAEKFKKSKEQRAKLAPQERKVAILSRKLSILAVGQQKDINDLMNYTVYQLMDEFDRFELKLHYDAWIKFKVAGATGMKDPEDWLKDIHE